MPVHVDEQALSSNLAIDTDAQMVRPKRLVSFSDYTGPALWAP